MPPDMPNPESAAARTGFGNDVCFGSEHPDSAPAQKYQARNLARRDRARMLAAHELRNAPASGDFAQPARDREAKLCLLREAIFENLRATRLFIDTAQMLIEARDDAGMARSVKMSARHFRAAAATVNELSKLKAEASR